MADSKLLPYGAEYAKSGRSSCKACRLPISQGAVRLSMRKPSSFFDGLQDNWHHFDCFWIRLRTEINEASIRGIENLRWEDAERVRRAIEEHSAKPLSTPGRTPAKVELKAEYAKSAAGKCFECKEKVPKGDLKLGHKAHWYHLDCFSSASLDFTGTAKDITGFFMLEEEDKSRLVAMFPKQEDENNENGEPLAKRSCPETPQRPQEDSRNKIEMKEQSLKMWTLRELFSDLRKAEVIEVIEYNHGFAPKKGGESARLDLLVDFALFGVPERCPKCGHSGTVHYSTSIHEYRCMGHISEYTRCSYTTKQPDRVPFKLPKEIRENHPQLEKYHKKRPSDRIYPAYLSNQEVVNTPSTSYTPARNYKSGHREEGPVYVKHGYAVDPECDDYEQFHVYIDRDDGNKAWQASLGAADVQLNRNSYYKLQLVQHDKRSKFMLFRSWGRIGTTIGGCKTESFGSDLDAAKEAFEFQFHEKSGNEWSHVENFKKKAGFLDLLEMEMLQDKKTDLKLNLEESKSKLHRSIQELMAMIFDVDAMKDVMKEMEVDTEKLPLGKLSKKHVLNAYSVLTELQNLFKNNEGYVDRDMILDATNRFYTLIPHDTGMAPVAVLDNHEIIKDKTELLDNLLEIQLAYTIVKREVDDDEGMDPIDESYAKLNVQMEVLDKESDEFQQLLTYMTNTHASTHDAYSLEVVDVYKVERQGEKERFKGDLHNRRLLWHGSRLTNYAGILSEGLRIAPPEAPVTGYMFGKGIYFADMVSKSANYCHALEKEGLLLLCDVALGDMQEEVHAKNITKLRKGKHSCKGLGLTYPDPKQVTYNEEGVMIPYGKPVSPATKDPLDLLYNEYIVYDESQVTIKYLVRAKFNPTITLL